MGQFNQYFNTSFVQAFTCWTSDSGSSFVDIATSCQESFLFLLYVKQHLNDFDSFNDFSTFRKNLHYLTFDKLMDYTFGEFPTTDADSIMKCFEKFGVNLEPFQKDQLRAVTILVLSAESLFLLSDSIKTVNQIDNILR